MPTVDSDDALALVKAAADNWERHWSNAGERKNIPFRHTQLDRIRRFFKRAGGGELIYRIIRRELGKPTGRIILEAGSGSGDISLRLAESGNNIVLLDTSISALKDCKERASTMGVSAYPVNGSILSLPFKKGVFDSVFSVGVLDHFGPLHRSAAIGEMLRVSRYRTPIVIATNDARSIIHPRAMKHAIKTGRWRYGFKDALYSLRDFVANIPNCCVVREYSRGFVSQFEFLHYYLPWRGFRRWLFFRLFFLLTFPFNFLNRLPGHFLISVLEKKNKSG